MTDEPALTPDQLARQAKQHLDSLRAAGIEWLPDAAPPAVQFTVPVAPASLPVLTDPPPVRPTLFEAQPSPAPAAGALSLDQRKEALAALAVRVSQCMRCAQLASTRTQTVFGVGALDPDLCFIGEAPGADEDRLG